MSKGEIQSAVGILFLLCLAFIILAVFNVFGEEVKTIMLTLMSFLAVGMVGAVCYMAIQQH